MREQYKLDTHPKANDGNIITGKYYRITILTSGMVRLEYSEEGRFEDRPSQMVLNRDFPEVDYRLIQNKDGIEIITSRVHVIYNEKEFSCHGLSIQVTGNLSAYHSIWRYSGEISDLKGTARTLDLVDGATPLDHGVLSRFGYSVLDDSHSMLLTEDNWVEPGRGGKKDLYFFGYGHDYLECLKDFYHLCGKTPMLPRFALGNWWSRYYPYTEETYMELMDRFERENLPFTVAVIDMDWHLVDVDPKYGSGWTGYTWNRELFPDPARFLKRLHDRGMRATLNVHPADGIRAHEDMYQAMAEKLGIDGENEDPINFDITDPEFLDAYFTYAHHPNEDMGVDFWWVDWQQGGSSKIPGLDPLWMLNHYHYLDSGRNGKRPMTFSRYAGPGSHRYPVGFSGDTITTWESLAFQPYFTANASNIGYGWWSHDIGGHMMGYKDDEMAARWTQFGVFSPIMRLHSSYSIFNGKEPWRFKGETKAVMEDFLRLRHRMMPYLYTMNYRAYKEDKPLIMPLYYLHPEEKQAYEVPNEYYFGSELLVSAVTTPRLGSINVSKTPTWLPDGIWIDYFTGVIYEGGRTMNLYRPLETIPVLAKAGAILPLTDAVCASAVTRNPEVLRIRVYGGADGAFTLYEDDNETKAYETGVGVRTSMTWSWSGPSQSFVISPADGELSLIPRTRSYILDFTAVTDSPCNVTIGGDPAEYTEAFDQNTGVKTVTVTGVSVSRELLVEFVSPLALRKNPVNDLLFAFLNQAEISFSLKEEICQAITSISRIPIILSDLQSREIDDDLRGAVIEILTAHP